MSIIFEFLYSSKFHSISNLFLLFSSLFSHFSVSFQSVLLFVYKRRSALASFLRHFPHVFVWESSEKKAQPVTDSSVDGKTRRVSWLATLYLHLIATGFNSILARQKKAIPLLNNLKPIWRTAEPNVFFWSIALGKHCECRL